MKKFNKNLILSGLVIGGIIVALVQPIQQPIVEATPTSISRESLDSSGGDISWHANIWDVSEDGRYILYESSASDIVTGDTNSKSDMFVIDTTLNVTERVSVDSSENQADDYSLKGKISNDGRYVVFTSFATNLVSGDTNAKGDVFLRDRDAGTTVMVSLDSSGGLANDASDGADITEDGRFVVFTSSASDLVTGDTNGQSDIFVRDLVKNQNKRISVSEAGVEGDGQSYNASIDCEGRYISFISASTNLVSGDSNGYRDVFLYDSLGGLLDNVTIGGNHVSDGFGITCDGKKIVMHSLASNLVTGDTNSTYDVLVYSLLTDSLERVSLADDESQANGENSEPTISGDGRFVAFISEATNLIAGDSNAKKDVFVRDITNGTTSRISEKADGTQANDHSYRPFYSKDGSYVAFGSVATNLVSGDSNGVTDIFLANTGNSPATCY